MWLRATTIFVLEIASQDVLTDALQHRTRSRACFSVLSAAQRACVCLQALMVTSNHALATITGRLKKAVPSVLNPLFSLLLLLPLLPAQSINLNSDQLHFHCQLAKREWN